VDLTEAITSRQSVPWLSGPAPDDVELLQLVEMAMTAPDHGRLRPWRLVLIRGDARRVLGAAMARCAASVAEREHTATKPMRAPLLVGIVFTPKDNPKVPEWEQLAATSAVVNSLGLLLHASGWGSIWRTGGLVGAGPVRDALGLGATEQLLGWLYVGTADLSHRRPPRPAADPAAHVLVLHDDGRLSSVRPREALLHN
jgi:nitroreductase